MLCDQIDRAVPHSLDLVGRPFMAHRDLLYVSMDDLFLVTCPYCGEQTEIFVEADTTGSFVQDCEVCCNPWRVSVSRDGDATDVQVSRADGSE